MERSSVDMSPKRAPRPSLASDHSETPRAPQISSSSLSRDFPALSPTAIVPRRPPSPFYPWADNLQSPGAAFFHAAPASPATSPATSTAQQRMSLSGRPRRPSPLLHEIQPPSRRLSALQVLLLTPFGTQLPSTVGGHPAAGAGMTRGSSSMASTAAPTVRVGKSGGNFTNLPRVDSAIAAALSSTPSSMGMRREEFGSSVPPPIQSVRQHTLMSHHALSPLAASQPMTTISSESSGSDYDSTAHASWQGADEEEDDTMFPPMEALWSATVAMTRSNSLPVLTLRELQALKQKDGELGIARGGDWAWVSREPESEEESTDDSMEDTPGFLANDTNTSASSTSLSSISSSTPAYFPFTSFSDPFAQPAVTGLNPPLYVPPSTAPGYRYSPTPNETRRMSETPLHGSHPPSTRGRSDAARRPSAPARTVAARASIASSPNRSSTPAGLTPRAVSGPFEQGPSNGSLRSSSRPRLLRYKSSPARSTGLGLDILVRSTGPTPGTNTGRTSPDYSSLGPRSSGAGTRSGSITEQSRRASEADWSDTTPHARSLGSRVRRRRLRPSLGSWAAVDILDSFSLPSTDNIIGPTPSTRSSLSASSDRRPSIQLISPSSFPIGSNAFSSYPRQGADLMVVEQIAQRSHLSEFGANVPPGGHPSWPFGLQAGGSNSLTALGGSVGRTKESWPEVHPRRGSLAVLHSMYTPIGVGAEGGTVSMDEMPAGSWTERRGSWADGWGRKEG